MKNIKYLFMFIFSVLLLTGCSAPADLPDPTVGDIINETGSETEDVEEDGNEDEDNEEEGSTDEEFSLDLLSQNNGKDGSRCLFAVDGVVYEVAGSNVWRDGEHTVSGGDAYCGADMTQALANSPHGPGKLTSTVVSRVGVLVQ